MRGCTDDVLLSTAGNNTFTGKELSRSQGCLYSNICPHDLSM